MSAGGIAQDKVDDELKSFSGYWVRDDKRSRTSAQDEVDSILNDEQEKIGIKRAIKRNLIISQSGSEIVLTMNSFEELFDSQGKLVNKNEWKRVWRTLYVDGRIVNDVLTSGTRTQTKTSFEKRKIRSVVRTEFEKKLLSIGHWGRERPTNLVSYRETILELSKDGRELIIEEFSRSLDSQDSWVVSNRTVEVYVRR